MPELTKSQNIEYEFISYSLNMITNEEVAKVIMRALDNLVEKIKEGK